MSSFNKVMLMGNLTRDVQVKRLPSNMVVAEFGIACARRYRTAAARPGSPGAGEDREETAFVDCTAFGRQAEVLSQFCRKGKPLFIEGRLKYDSWDDKQTGHRRSKLSVVVENFQFVGGRDDSAGPGSPNADVFGNDRPHRTERAETRRTPGAPGPDDNNAAESPASATAQRKRRARTAQLPFEQEKQFEEADIPF